MLKIVYQQKALMGLLVWLLCCALSLAVPTGSRSASLRLDQGTCLALGRALLHNVTAALAVDQLFRGLNCMNQTAELHNSTRTLSVCVPELSICSGSNDFTVNQEECAQGILEDLRYYWATFKSYSDPKQVLEQSVIRSIEDLVQGCFSASMQGGPQFQVSTERENPFNRRLKLCKVLLGFQIRSITINRVLNHLLTV